MENISRIRSGLDDILPVLKDFIKKSLQKKYDDHWIEKIIQNVSFNANDVSFIDGNSPEEVFDNSIDLSLAVTIIQAMWYDFKRYGVMKSQIMELKDWRNTVSHTTGNDLSEKDACRALDTMALICDKIAPEKSESFRSVIRGIRYAENGSQHALKMTKKMQTKLEKGAVRPDFAAKLPAWREVIEPNADVAAGVYKTADFAVNLGDVVQGKGSNEYLDPVNFFHRTYVTNGIKNLLVQAIRRVTGCSGGGDPVIQLKTSFGGGKTHTMLALYHLMRKNVPIDKMRGMREVLDAAGVEDIPKVKVAVIVGTDLDPSKEQAPAYLAHKVRTVWGSIAAQLAFASDDPSLFELVQKADQKSVSPGKDTLAELFDRCGPCLILIDEFVAYARKLHGADDKGLPAGTFGNMMTFIQELTEAAKASQNSLVVASIPESDEEIGDNSGRIAFGMIEKTFGRVESVWNPVEAAESFEIVRRRLFKTCDSEDKRDQVCAAFSEMYGAMPDAFPQDTGNSAYAEKLKSCYPIHPTIFDYLYGAWSVIDKFQRTRGVLRFMAGVVHYLWQIDDQSPFIMPWAVPFCNLDISGELTKYLNDSQSWSGIIDKEVDGDGAIPNAIDAGETRFGKICAARRIARTLMFATSPSKRVQKVRGMSQLDIHLCVMMPGEKPAVYDDALDKLEDKLSYLYTSSDNSRYWFDTRPTLRKMMFELKEKFDEIDVLNEIRPQLRAMFKQTAPFKSVHVCPDSGADIGDDSSLRLVVLKPEHSYTDSRDGSITVHGPEIAAEMLRSKGEKPRLFKNMIMFAAAEHKNVENMFNLVRQYLAWHAIECDTTLDIGKNEISEVANNAKESRKQMADAIRNAYRWLMIPVGRDDELNAVEWEFVPIQGRENVMNALIHTIREGDYIVEKWTPRFLKDRLKRYYWKDGRHHIEIKALWQHLASYLYMDRLAGESVLIGCIENGVADGTFGYAADCENGIYKGLVFAEPHVSVDMHNYIVEADTAAAQIEAERAAERRREAELRREDPDSSVSACRAPDCHGSQTDNAAVSRDRHNDHIEAAQREPVKHRYYACKNITADAVNRDLNPTFLSQVVNELLTHLSRDGADIEIRFEIEAVSDAGFRTSTTKVIAENANTLNFNSNEFYEE